jgi:hypothetical protein
MVSIAVTSPHKKGLRASDDWAITEMDVSAGTSFPAGASFGQAAAEVATFGVGAGQF